MSDVRCITTHRSSRSRTGRDVRTIGGVRVGIATIGYGDTDFVVEAERLGADSVWIAETWGGDAFTPLAFLAARTTTIGLATGIAQLGTRTPANLAMTAMSMQVLSGGRFRLGIGTSGPQVMEGWHGVRFSAPVGATRETIEIMRKVAHGDRLAHDGASYQIPLPDGQGRPMRSQLPPCDLPIYVAALGPRNLELTGELADGWLGNAFVPEHAEAFLEPLRSGAAKAGRTIADLDLVMPVAVEFTDDVEEAAARHARGYAFTIGAMGSKAQNFYTAAFARQGYAEQVEVVQDLWLAGRREEAADRVPLELGLKTNLLGPPSMVAERVRCYADAGITTLQAKLSGRPDRAARHAGPVARRGRRGDLVNGLTGSRRACFGAASASDPRCATFVLWQGLVATLERSEDDGGYVPSPWPVAGCWRWRPSPWCGCRSLVRRNRRACAIRRSLRPAPARAPTAATSWSRRRPRAARGRRS